MAKQTYQDLIDADRDVSVKFVKVARKMYAVINDGQYVWATPKADYNRVARKQVEIVDDGSQHGDWYGPFCQSLPYDGDFCRAHEAELGQWNWA